MAVYDISGTELQAVYNIVGTALEQAYDIDGELVFPVNIPNMTVMTFNVGCFYSEWHPAPSSVGTVFYQRHKNIFDKYNTDFAGMSEWCPVIGTVNASVLMNEFFESYYPDDTPYGVEGASLTSAFSQVPSSVTLVQYQTQGSENRYYQKSYINYYGKSICCILTHLDLNDSVRTAQFLELMNAVQNEQYFIITGDFNFEITSVGDNQYNKSVKVALDNGYNSAQNSNGIYTTWYSGQTVASSQNKYALDNIITSSNIDILNVVIDDTKLTDGLCEDYGIIIDHLPMVATLRIN